MRLRWSAVTALWLLASVLAWGGPPDVATRTRMGRHGAHTMELVKSVVLLDHDTTARLARQIADDEALAGPLDEKRGEVPELFVSFQVDLRRAAKRLADHAAVDDDLGVAEAFSAMTKTCVLCHHNYLKPSVARPVR